jgi:hypothetical protein
VIGSPSTSATWPSPSPWLHAPWASWSSALLRRWL